MKVLLLLMSQAPSVRIINDSAQFFPIGIARYGAVGTQDKVGRCILQHLIDGFLSLFYRTSCNDSQTFQTTEDRTAKALLRLLQVKGRTIGEVQGEKFKVTQTLVGIVNQARSLTSETTTKRALINSCESPYS